MLTKRLDDKKGMKGPAKLLTNDLIGICHFCQILTAVVAQRAMGCSKLEVLVLNNQAGGAFFVIYIYI